MCLLFPARSLIIHDERFQPNPLLWGHPTSSKKDLPHAWVGYIYLNGETFFGGRGALGVALICPRNKALPYRILYQCCGFLDPTDGVLSGDQGIRLGGYWGLRRLGWLAADTISYLR